jgi:hypothetical protein
MNTILKTQSDWDACEHGIDMIDVLEKNKVDVDVDMLLRCLFDIVEHVIPLVTIDDLRGYLQNRLSAIRNAETFCGVTTDSITDGVAKMVSIVMDLLPTAPVATAAMVSMTFEYHASINGEDSEAAKVAERKWQADCVRKYFPKFNF